MEKKNIAAAYNAPEIQVLDVIIEGVLCESSTPNSAFQDFFTEDI